MEDKTIEDVTDEEIFTIVDQMPEYPGGEEALKEYIKDNISYPAQAKEEFIEGKVFVSFIILPNGNVDHVKVIKGIGGGCDEEAVRVISEMPNWSPGYKEGVAVKVEHTLPINFALH
jgi:TonB family protein